MACEVIGEWEAGSNLLQAETYFEGQGIGGMRGYWKRKGVGGAKVCLREESGGGG